LNARKIKIDRKYFDEWAKDKSLLLSTASLALSESAEDCFEFLQMFKSRRLARKIPFRSTPNQWLNLYRDHRKLYKSVSDALRALDSKTSEVVDFYEFILKCFNESKKMNLEEKRKALESLSPEELKETVTIIKESARELEDWVIKLRNYLADKA
jgi:hypothetical protein